MQPHDRSLKDKTFAPIYFEYRHPSLDKVLKGVFSYGEGNLPYLYGDYRVYGFVNGKLVNREEVLEDYVPSREPLTEQLDFNYYVREELLTREVKWDYRHLELATWYGNRNSKDPSTKVGAVITDPFDETVVSLGFNGFARGVPDHKSDYMDRDRKYPRVIHAEMNAIMTAKSSLRGMSIYTSSLSPCMRCASCLIQAGISKVVFYSFSTPERWRAEMEDSIAMMKSAGVTVYSLPPISIIKSEFVPKKEEDSCC